MINLIPSSAKKDIVVEYWIRVMSVWLVIWSVVLLIGSCILLPVYVLIGSQVSALLEPATEASQKVLSYGAVSEMLEEASQQARFTLDELDLPPLSGYLELFESLQGSTIQLNEISLVREQEGMAPVILVGIAADRQSLAAFRDRVVARDEVVGVDLPISNLAQDKDIPFTVTVTLLSKTDI